jgi:hypothetical protein
MKKLITASTVALFALSGNLAWAADAKAPVAAKPAASAASAASAPAAKAAPAPAAKKEKKGGC